jgi:bromodomain-containing factor 1
MLDATTTIAPAPATTCPPNGLHYDPTTDPDSPLADSPDTPINTVSDVAVKITSDVPEVESDVRHEPYQISLSKLDDASLPPQIDTPIAPDLTSPSHGTPPLSATHFLRDLSMVEEDSQPQNGIPQHEDVEMGDAEPPKSSFGGPAEADEQPPTQSSTGTPGSAVGDDAPPAKRARKFSDADQASAHQTVAHISHAPGQESAAPVNGELPPSTLSLSQHKFALSTIRTLKKMKDATPFRSPVDPEALKIPHYLQIIKHPMDFSTIERKLLASNPVKPDPNPSNPRYVSADEFVADVRLIFSNCLTFNGPEHVVTQQGKRVEAVFDKQIKQLPPPEEVR